MPRTDLPTLAAAYALGLLAAGTFLWAAAWPILHGQPGRWEWYPLVLFALVAHVLLWTDAAPRPLLSVAARWLLVLALLVLLCVLRTGGGQ